MKKFGRPGAYVSGSWKSPSPKAGRKGLMLFCRKTGGPKIPREHSRDNPRTLERLSNRRAFLCPCAQDDGWPQVWPLCVPCSQRQCE